MRYLFLNLSVLIAATLFGCSDTNINETHEALFAVGGVVYVGDLPSENVTITINNTVNSQWTTTSNSDGLWRIDGPLKPDTYTIEYLTPELPPRESIFTISPNGYYYSNIVYTNIENDYIYIGQVNLTEQPLEASVTPFSLTMQNQQEYYGVSEGQVIQYSLSVDSDIVISFNYPLWSATDVCLLDSNEVPLFNDTNGDGQGDYPLCATFNAVDSTYTFSRSSLDQAYLGMDNYGFVGTSTLTGLVADNISSTHYLLWIGVKVVEYTTDFAFEDYQSDAAIQAFSPQFGTEFLLQGKVYFNVVP